MQTKMIPVLLAPALLLAFAAPALAGNGNTLYLVQESPPGSTDGNNFLSDQTWANYSSIGTPSHPAVQTGSGNSARITIKSDCAAASSSSGHLSFRQDNSGGGLVGIVANVFNLAPLAPNTADITINGQGGASVLQIGGGNEASLMIADAVGSVSQAGLNNEASLTVAANTSGNISQTGVGNIGELTVNSIGGAGVSLIQIGATPHSGSIAVDSTSPVTIYQIGF